MKKRVFAAILLTALMLGTLYIVSNVRPVRSWSNGGYSSDPNNPLYGTHDWIAQHALDWLPTQEKEYILNNLATYLYGTELPDNGGAPDGIGDTPLHHIYYWSTRSIEDDASAIRAETKYNEALGYLLSGNFAVSVKTLGVMSHYIVDVGVFGHVMGAETDWGNEVHHGDYETYVNEGTNNYNDEFNTYLVFDGNLELTLAYDAACRLAYDTTFDADESLTCVWMDQHYNWSNPVFKDRCGESLNLAVNLLTDVLHTFYMQSIHKSTRYPWPMFHHDLGHTGYTESPAPRTNQTLWTYPGGSISSSPAVADGKVYIGSYDRNVYCLNALNGSRIWDYTTGDTVTSSPAIADGKDYFGSCNRCVYALNALTGSLIWNY